MDARTLPQPASTTTEVAASQNETPQHLDDVSLYTGGGLSAARSGPFATSAQAPCESYPMPEQYQQLPWYNQLYTSSMGGLQIQAWPHMDYDAVAWGGPMDNTMGWGRDVG